MEKGKWAHAQSCLCPVSLSMHSEPGTCLTFMADLSWVSTRLLLFLPCNLAFWQYFYSNIIDLTGIFPSLTIGHLHYHSPGSWKSWLINACGKYKNILHSHSEQGPDCLLNWDLSPLRLSILYHQNLYETILATSE